MNLREKDKLELIRISQKAFKNKIEIWAYGSRVDNTNHEASDLDLVIRSSDLSPLPIDELSLFGEMLEESNLPILVDYLDWGRIPQKFQERILQNYETIL